MNSGPHGFLDTNVVVHSLTNDEHLEECRRFLNQIQSGTRSITLDPLVVHELTFTIPRYAKQMSRDDVADFLLSLISQPGISIITIVSKYRLY